MRFVTPVLFAAAAGYVAWYNGQHADRALVLPGMDLLDADAATSPARQGELTVMVLVGIAGITGAWELFRWLRERGQE